MASTGRGGEHKPGSMHIDAVPGPGLPGLGCRRQAHGRRKMGPTQLGRYLIDVYYIVSIPR